MSEENQYGGVGDYVIETLLKNFGITKEHINKVRSILDNIEIINKDGITTITIKVVNK
jgi:hypothetical protein